MKEMNVRISIYSMEIPRQRKESFMCKGFFIESNWISSGNKGINEMSLEKSNQYDITVDEKERTKYVLKDMNEWISIQKEGNQWHWWILNGILSIVMF